MAAQRRKRKQPEPKSSPEARRLIRAAKTLTGSLRGAAEMLGIPNPAHAQKILAGEMRDSAAMRAALLRCKHGVYRVRYAGARTNGKLVLGVDAEKVLELSKLVDDILYNRTYNREAK